MTEFNLIFDSKPVDILRELNEFELIELENLYKNQLIDLKYHYLLIYNQRIWNEKIDEFSKQENNNSKNLLNFKPFYKKFYTHRNGNLLKNGTYFSFAIDCKFTITCHTLEATSNELEECLKHTKYIPWKDGPLFTALHVSLMPLVEKIALENGGLMERNRECVFYLYGNKIAKNIKINTIEEKYSIRPLSKENTDFIHKLWPHNKEASVDFLYGLTVLNKSLGIFLEDSLVAWIFQNEFSGIGILHVVTEQRRKGLAKILTEMLVKEIAVSDENIDVSAFTVFDNLQSQNLLKNVGFQKIITTYWMQLVKVE